MKPSVMELLAWMGIALILATVKKTIQHSGGHVMVWGCFLSNGVDSLDLVESKMNELTYKYILKNVIQPFAECNMLLKWNFEQDNYPKHTYKLVLK